MLVLKAMIYVTTPQGVLVFEEPESPHIGLQVPGGTIEQGEARFSLLEHFTVKLNQLDVGIMRQLRNLERALRFHMNVNRSSRELFEETGLSAKDGLQFLGLIDFALSEKGQPYTMRRYYYHAHFEEVLPESWEHYEMDACDGSDPILFRLFWLPHEIARQRLAYGMAELLHHVPVRAPCAGIGTQRSL